LKTYAVSPVNVIAASGTPASASFSEYEENKGYVFGY